MQIKEKFNLSFFKNKKQALFKVVFSVLGFVSVAVIAYLILFICKFLNLFSILNYIPVNVMAFVLGIMFVINVFSSTIILSRSLYYSQDNQVLITYPVNANSIFISKLVVHYIGELKRTFSFLVPVFFAYGLISGSPIIYYLWMPIMFCLLAVITVLIAGIISIPCSVVIRLLNRFKILKILISVSLLILVGCFAFFAISKIPADINILASWREISIFIRDLLSNFVHIFNFVYIFTIALCGNFEGFKIKLFSKYSLIVPAVMLGIIAILLVLNFALSRPIYLRALSSSFEHNKFKKREKKNKVINSNLSISIYEFKKIFRQTETITNALMIIVIAPIAILALNKIYGAINTRMLGDYLTIAFNILIILLFALSCNIPVSSIYSRDGESFYTNKAIPKKPYQILFARLMFNGLLSFIVLVLTTPIFFYFSKLSVLNKIVIFISLFILSLLHLFWTAEIDFSNLQIQNFHSFGRAGINPNELKSTILAFAISLITFAVTAFFLIKDYENFYLKLLIVSTVILAVRIALFHYKAKVLFKEK